MYAIRVSSDRAKADADAFSYQLANPDSSSTWTNPGLLAGAVIGTC